jgi:hypothetical protein
VRIRLLASGFTVGRFTLVEPAPPLEQDIFLLQRGPEIVIEPMS